MTPLASQVARLYPHYVLRAWCLCTLEVAAIALLFLLTKPYFESYQVFWYLLAVLLVPVIACSVAVNCLTKLASHAIAVRANSPLTSTSTTQWPFVSPWHCVSWPKIMLMIMVAALPVWCYSISAQGLAQLVLLFAAVLFATFAVAVWLLTTAAVPYVMGVLCAFKRRRLGLSEQQSLLYIIRYYVCPWSLIALLTLLVFFIKYYLGRANSNGLISGSEVVAGSYLYSTVVALWLWFEVTQNARLDRILGKVKLLQVGRFTRNEAVAVVLALPLLLAVAVAAANNFLAIEHYSYQSAIVVNVLATTITAIATISIAILQLCGSKRLCA